jgi:hypothetical protein
MSLHICPSFILSQFNSVSFSSIHHFVILSFFILYLF